MVLIALLSFLLISSCGVVQIRDRETSVKPPQSDKRQTVDVRYTREGNRVFIDVSSDRKADYRVFSLKDPDRVVLDFFGNVDVVVHVPEDVKHRLGKQPWGLRLVFELQHESLNTSPTQSGFRVSVRLSYPKEQAPVEEKRTEKPQEVPKVNPPVRGSYERRERGYYIKTPCDAFFRSVEDGTVLYSGDDLKQYAWVIMVEQVDGYISVYARAGSSFVRKGEKVKKGQVLGKVGREENACGILYELRAKDGSSLSFEMER